MSGVMRSASAYHLAGMVSTQEFQELASLDREVGEGAVKTKLQALFGITEETCQEVRRLAAKSRKDGF